MDIPYSVIFLALNTVRRLWPFQTPKEMYTSDHWRFWKYVRLFITAQKEHNCNCHPLSLQVTDENRNGVLVSFLYGVTQSCERWIIFHFFSQTQHDMPLANLSMANYLTSKYRKSVWWDVYSLNTTWHIESFYYIGQRELLFGALRPESSRCVGQNTDRILSRSQL